MRSRSRTALAGFVVVIVSLVGFRSDAYPETGSILPPRRGFIEMEGGVHIRALDPRLSETVTKTIQILRGPIKLHVKFQKGNDAWARYTLTMAERFIVGAEKYLGVPLQPPKGSITIFELLGPTAYCGGYDEIHTNGDAWAVGSPGLLFHEIGHLYFGPGFMSHYSEWHSQGQVSFLPVAMADAGFLTLSKEEYASIFKHWVFAGPRPSNDVPLEEYGRRPEDKEHFLLYIKSFRVQYMLYRELGADSYRRFLARLLKENKTGTEEFLRILQAEKSDTDWKSLLSGWVFPGTYKRFSWDSFQDSDRDGVSDIDEIYAGLNPKNPDTDVDSYADGWERTHGFDPMSKKSPGRHAWIAVDGLVDAAKSKSAAEQTDASGDSTASTDIAGGEVFVIENRVFVRYSFSKLETRPIQLTLHIRRKDGRNFWWQTRTDAAYAWTGMVEFDDGEPFEKWKPSKTAPTVIEHKLGRVFEAAFDAAAFGLSDEFQVEFKAGGYTDRNESWESDSTDLLRVSLRGTDLRR